MSKYVATVMIANCQHSTNVNNATAPFQGAEQTLCSYICGDITQTRLSSTSLLLKCHQTTTIELRHAPYGEQHCAMTTAHTHATVRCGTGWLGGQLIATEAACQGRLCELTHTLQSDLAQPSLTRCALFAISSL